MENKIKERLQELLEENEITPYKLAKDLNISKSVLHYWLVGKTTPNVEYIIQLAKYFKTTSDFLIGLEDEPKAQNVAKKDNKTYNNNGVHIGEVKF